MLGLEVRIKILERFTKNISSIFTAFARFDNFCMVKSWASLNRYPWWPQRIKTTWIYQQAQDSLSPFHCCSISFRNSCSSHMLKMYRINESCRAVELRVGWLWVVLLMLGAITAPPTTFLSYLILFLYLAIMLVITCHLILSQLADVEAYFNPCMQLPSSCPL